MIGSRRGPRTMFGLTWKDLAGATLLVVSLESNGCSLLLVPRPARAARDPQTSCSDYFLPGLDMTAALLSGLTVVSVLFAPDQMTSNGQSVDTTTRVTGAAGVGALTSGFVASALVGMNWIEGCRRLKAAQAVERPPATLRVQKRPLPPGPEESPVPRLAPIPETEYTPPSSPAATPPPGQSPATMP